MTKSLEEIKSNRHRAQQIKNFEESDMLKNYLANRPHSDKLKESIIRGANNALDRIDAENAGRKERGEAPLPEDYSQLFIDKGKGVVYTKFDAIRQRERDNEMNREECKAANETLGVGSKAYDY